MRKLILQVAVSLDGFIEGANGEYDWCFTDQDYGLTEFFKTIDAVIYGRKSWELMQKVDDELTAGFPKLKSYVFSKTLSSVEEDAVLVTGDLASEVMKIKQEPGKDIWVFGGASLTTSLMNAGLLDEISLAVHPLVLGAGKPLFQNIHDRTKLTLLDNKVYNTGLVSLTYAVENNEAAG